MEIKWSKYAQYDLEEIEDYIGKNFTFKEFESFWNILNQKIELIRFQNIEFEKLQKNSKFNKCLISKQTTMIYVKEKDCLKIYRLFNNFQDEDKKFVIEDI